MGESKIQSYRDLKVWQEAVNLVEICYCFTKTLPKEELYGMTTQIRRASVSIAANIAEGYGRKTRGEYIQFLYIAQGSLKELETHLLIAQRVELTSDESINPTLNQCESVGRLLLALIRSLENK
ncbi:MAG TPA: diversity-generating retroelement protein bAvd family protein [Cyanobacteria bacterium UBA11370]|nr:diversity-generating retroelement protein bAvd family protein [Cyanobacteria bacterium UBA11370]